MMQWINILDRKIIMILMIMFANVVRITLMILREVLLYRMEISDRVALYNGNII